MAALMQLCAPQAQGWQDGTLLQWVVPCCNAWPCRWCSGLAAPRPFLAVPIPACSAAASLLPGVPGQQMQQQQ